MEWRVKLICPGCMPTKAGANMNLWSGYSAKELEEKIKQGHTTAILPFGSVEQHGNHLATGYDILIAERIARDLALKINALILPNFSIGEASHHIGFPGTLSFSNNTLQRMLILDFTQDFLKLPWPSILILKLSKLMN